MAQFEDETVPKNAWKDLHTAVGVAAPATLILQNTGNTPFRVAESVAPPTELVNFGVLMQPDVNTQLESKPGAGESTWVISFNQSAEGKVAVVT